MKEWEKEFYKEVFEWIKVDGVERGYFNKNWKNDLIDYIYNEMAKEGKIVKKESIRRNINRMISYYYGTGAQARSGRRYLTYFERLFEEFKQDMLKIEAIKAHEFLTAQEAKIYIGEITVLRSLPDFKSKTISVYRLHTS